MSNQTQFNPNEQTVRKNTRKRRIDPKSGLTVYGDDTVYFSNYLEIYIGAKWRELKGSLYDAGYQTAEINRYRCGQIKDFISLCRERDWNGIV